MKSSAITGIPGKKHKKIYLRYIFFSDLYSAGNMCPKTATLLQYNILNYFNDTKAITREFIVYVDITILSWYVIACKPNARRTGILDHRNSDANEIIRIRDFAKYVMPYVLRANGEMPKKGRNSVFDFSIFFFPTIFKSKILEIFSRSCSKPTTDNFALLFVRTTASACPQ